jgi:hypothetical protein
VRRREFEKLLLQLRPTRLWIVLLIEYEGSEDEGFVGANLDGELQPDGMIF